MDKEEKERVYNTLERIEVKINDIDKTLHGQHLSLQEHMRRSDALEKLYETLKKELEPVKKFTNYFEGVLKFVGILALSVGLVYNFIKIVQFF